MNSRSFISRRLLPLCLLLLVLAAAGGCEIIQGTVPSAVLPASAPDVFKAGAARADITPLPGYPKGGHSAAGTVGRGYWTRLWANAIYLQDPQGHAIAMVSCDLFAIPAGLADRVAELLAEHAAADGSRLGRGQIILSATHTHHGPGNFLSSILFNALASPQMGFDRDLFEFLAQQISDAIRQAHCGARPARLESGETCLKNVARNRSMEAFGLNPEAAELIHDNKDLALAAPDEEYPDPLAARAIYPQCTVWRIVDRQSNRLIALSAFLAMHPTSTEHTCSLYNGELFGAAAILIQRELLKQSGNTQASPPVVALFNGAEGDVSPIWYHRDRATTLDLAAQLSKSILETQVSPQAEPTIDYRFRVVPINGVTFPYHGRQVTTASFAEHGVGTVGGAEDGRSFLYDLGWKEDVTGPQTKEHGDKLGAADFRVQLPVPLHVTRLIERQLHAPRTVPVGVYTVGPFVLATLPGEFTTVMGKRIREQVGAALNRKDHVLLCGLTSEFIHYLTTPEEYAAQSYEGASTIYGPYSGTQIGYELELLAKKIAGHCYDNAPNERRELCDGPAHPQPMQFWYNAGSTAHFGLSNIAESPEAAAVAPATPDEGLSDIVEDPAFRRAVHTYPTVEWDDGPIDWNTVKANCTATPHVRLEQKINDVWQPVMIEGIPETDEGMNFVVVALSSDKTHTHWAAIWLAPRDGKGKALPPASDELRFHIEPIKRPAFDSPPIMTTTKDLYPWGLCPPDQDIGRRQPTKRRAVAPG